MDRQRTSDSRTNSRQAHALQQRQSSLRNYRQISRGVAEPVAKKQTISVDMQPVAAPNARPSLTEVFTASLQEQPAKTEEVQAQPAFTPMMASYQSSVDGFSYADIGWKPGQGAEEAPKAFLDTLASLSDGYSEPIDSVDDTGVDTLSPEPTYSLEEQVTAEVPSIQDEQSSNQLTDLYKSQQQTDEPKPLSHVKTLTFSALACGMVAVGIFTFFARVDSAPIVAQPVGPAVVEVEVPVNSSTQGDGREGQAAVAVDPTHPVRIVISKAGINAPVIGLGLTGDGLIDVPQSYGVVGWYNKGVVPGQSGPAVIVGHFTDGNGGAFDRLYQVQEGDLITVTNGRGQNFTYKMTKKKEYDTAKVPMSQIFASSDKSRLEIITCAGVWQSNDYNKRLVVTAELVR